MRREVTGQLWNKPVGKVKVKSKGHRSKFTREVIDDLASTSSRPRDTCGPKVKVSSHALDDDLNDAYDIYAACHAIDVACGAEVDDHTFDIDAACHAIDVACASKINDADINSDFYGDGKTSDDVNLIDDAVTHDVKCAFDDSSPAHDIHQAGYTTLHKAMDDGVMVDDERDDSTVKRDEISDACHWLANHDPACTNMASCGPSVNESNAEIFDAGCISSINDDNDSEVSLVESDGNSLSSGWYHVASPDAEDWYLC